MATGCYLGHIASGQMRLLWARTPVAQIDANPTTPTALRDRLELVAEVRAFAETLGLDVGGQYTSYAPWPGDALITTVVATRPGAVELVTSWFPIVGSVPYRGYFDAARAHAHADTLRADGLDVCVVPVRAYSTLGWFDDPLTGPMLRQPPPFLVETVLHELLHATVFVPGDAEFNEGVAAFFGQEARVRFYAERDGDAAEARERLAVAQQREVRAEILALRREVEALYAEADAGPERAARRAMLEGAARRRLAELVPDDLAGTSGERAAEGDAQRGHENDDENRNEAWAAGFQLNDACLALSGTYHADTPRLAAVLASHTGDLRAFLAAVERAADADDPRVALLGPDPPH